MDNSHSMLPKADDLTAATQLISRLTGQTTPPGSGCLISFESSILTTCTRCIHNVSCHNKAKGDMPQNNQTLPARLVNTAASCTAILSPGTQLELTKPTHHHQDTY